MKPFYQSAFGELVPTIDLGADPTAPGPLTIICGPLLDPGVINGNLPRRKFGSWEEYDRWAGDRFDGTSVRSLQFEHIADEGMHGWDAVSSLPHVRRPVRK